MSEDNQFCTDFAREHRTLSAALAHRDRDMTVLVGRLGEETLLDESLDSLVERVVSTTAGEPDGVGLPDNLQIAVRELEQRVGRWVELRGDRFEERIPSWSWELQFDWSGPRDLRGWWPDQTADEFSVATFDNHPNSGRPPTIKWTARGDILTATCFVPIPSDDQSSEHAVGAASRSQSEPPQALFARAVNHTQSYMEAFNRQVDPWRVSARARVTAQIRQRQDLTREGESRRAEVNELLRPNRVERGESAIPRTSKHVERVGVDDVASPTRSPLESQEGQPMSEADVVILTALEKEALAFLPHLQGWREVIGHRRYFAGEVSGLNVVIWPTGGMGNVRSAVATQQAIAVWNPGCILLAGIAAALDRNEVALGDVLVPEQLVAYEPGKVRPDGVSNRWEVFRASPAILQAARSVAGSDWHLSVVGAPPTKTAPTEVHFGVVLSGEKVVASAERAAELTAVWERAVGLEMEGVGVALAAYEGSVPLVGLVKGVCDYADEAKADDWQDYAAATSAAFVSLLISKLLIPRVRKQPQRADSPLSAAASPAGWGPRKVKLCRRLTALECRELADCFEIEPHERARWSDDLCDEVWNWLVRRDKLGELPDILSVCLERDDLVDVVKGL